MFIYPDTCHRMTTFLYSKGMTGVSGATFIVIYVQKKRLQSDLQYECEDWGWGVLCKKPTWGNHCRTSQPTGTNCAKVQLIKSISHQFISSSECIKGLETIIVELLFFTAIYKHFILLLLTLHCAG